MPQELHQLTDGIKMLTGSWKDEWTDRKTDTVKTVYPPHPHYMHGVGVIKTRYKVSFSALPVPVLEILSEPVPLLD